MTNPSSRHYSTEKVPENFTSLPVIEKMFLVYKFLFFLMWTIAKSFLNLLQNCFYVLCFGYLARRHVGS